MEKLKIIGISVALVVVFLMGTFISPYILSSANDEQLGVVVTILPLADFVEKIGGDAVEVTVMVVPGASPHTYEPTTSQMVAVSHAEMYVKVGSGVEFEEKWMENILSQNPNMFVVDCSQGITKIGTDPHIWNSPINAKQMVENIWKGLVEIDPGNEEQYTQNKDSYLQELDEVDAYIHQRLDNFINRVFLIYHPAFGYFANEYNLTQLAIEHGGKPPTPQVMQECLELADQYNLSYVFVAPQFATGDAETIAHEISGQTLFMDPLPSNYIVNMRSLTASLATEMEVT
jgi:zinc transport system substrate-binding protein